MTRSKLADTVAVHLGADLQTNQDLLKMLDPADRLAHMGYWR